MKLVFSTKEFPREKRFEAWRAGVCDQYVEVDMVDVGQSDYVGYIREASFGNVTLTDALAPRQHIVRRRSHLAKLDKDCVYVTFAIQGYQHLTQHGGTIVCGSGRAAMFSASEVYELENFDAERSLFLEFPRDELVKRLAGKSLPVNAGFQTSFGIGRMAAALCGTMAIEAENLGTDARSRLGETMLDIIALAIAERDPSDSILDSNVRAGRLRQIKSYIEANLHNPLLNPDRIAEGNEISVRTLHYLFKSEGTSVSEYLWNARLERCRKELELDIGLRRKIGDIAMDAGFNSLSHFSSVFRKRFGVSPTDIRDSRGHQ